MSRKRFQGMSLARLVGDGRSISDKKSLIYGPRTALEDLVGIRPWKGQSMQPGAGDAEPKRRGVGPRSSGRPFLRPGGAEELREMTRLRSALPTRLENLLDRSTEMIPR